MFFKYIITFFCLLSFNYVNSKDYFPYGVASGDPTSNSIILWTSIDSEDTTDKRVSYEISETSDFKKIIDSNHISAKKEHNFSIKIDVENLKSNTWYYYRFKYKKQYSITGRTKTAPINNEVPTRFAVVSCSNYEHGYFNVYKDITEHNNVDAIIHLGDYIYEYGTGNYSANLNDRKTYPLHEIITLQDYRERYAHYRKDTNLQKLHQNFPFINIWDDHEIANNSYVQGAKNHTDSTEGSFKDRLSAAKKAFYEWLPIRETNHDRLYRRFNFGKNINLIFLDTRIEGRDKQENRKKKNAKDSTRRLIGDEQFNWLIQNLGHDTNTWNIIAQQVMIAPFKVSGIIANPDQWDGYLYEKQRLLNYINESSLKNLIVLTGDLHSAWANQIPDKNNKHKSVGVEFITPSITSARGIPVSATLVKMFNPHVKYLNLKQHGYIEITINQNNLIASFQFVSDILTENFNTINGPAFKVDRGSTNLQKIKEKPQSKNTNPPIVNY